VWYMYIVEKKIRQSRQHQLQKSQGDQQ
jgi:hypothetical protein